MNGVRVYAAIERDSGVCMMQVVPDRTVQTLVPIIQQWCLPCTHIISDGWAAYKNLAQLKGGGVSPRCSCPPTELHGSTTPRGTHPKHREPLDALNASCVTSSAPQVKSLTLICVNSCGRRTTKATSSD